MRINFTSFSLLPDNCETLQGSFNFVPIWALYTEAWLSISGPTWPSRTLFQISSWRTIRNVYVSKVSIQNTTYYRIYECKEYDKSDPSEASSSISVSRVCHLGHFLPFPLPLWHKFACNRSLLSMATYLLWAVALSFV